MKIIWQDANKSKTEKWLWTLLMIFGLLGVILKWIVTYTITNSNQISLKEILMPVHFTHISILMGALLGIIMFFNFDLKIKFIQDLIVITFINLAIAMLVYFGLILPKRSITHAIKWVSTIISHLVIPIIMILIFLFITLENNEFKWKIKPWKKSLFYLIFPITWLIIAITIYFGFQMDSDAAIYSYLDFKNQKWYKYTGFIVGVATLYYLISLLGTWLTTRKNQK